MKRYMFCLMIVLIGSVVFARECHVSVNGSDENDGSAQKPFKTIMAAARAAYPGDVVTVHQGIYRERVIPPRSGKSDGERIVYQGAPGEKVTLKGSEVIKSWVRVQNDTWKVTIPNSFFGDFNPFNDLIHGDWFDSKGRDHHTGAVYLDGRWLTEAATLEEVLEEAGQSSLLIAPMNNEYLLNMAWIRICKISEDTERIPAANYAAQQGIQTAPCSEGGECIGWIQHGDWVRYERIDFGRHTEQLDILAASDTDGGIIEIHLDTPKGDLLGICSVPNTGGWQSWASFRPTIRPVTGIQTLCFVFKMPQSDILNSELWFAQVDTLNTTIWAQFKGINPNEAEVEINVRQTVFYPDKPNMNYLTVRNFTLIHAATPWAPPTAEQIGLVGTHWSKGWIIENNDIRYSTCAGISLGKYGDPWDNTSQNTAEGYVKTIERALENGWSKENIGHHIVRNNHISHCEQAGIVGSLGAVFSTITGNNIHDIHIRRLFSGAEMAGIKIHAAIDTEISKNHIHRTCRGIWLDWMAQGTRVTANLLHDNKPGEDLFVEVNHGPFVVDNNLFLSRTALLDMSQGGAYLHNLFAGRIHHSPELSRSTPYLKAHSTEVAGLQNISGGDNRFYNNIFVNGDGLVPYDKAALPVQMAGNIFLKGPQASMNESAPLVRPDFNPAIKLVENKDDVSLSMTFQKAWAGNSSCALITTNLLGRSRIPDLPYQQSSGSSLKIDTDYFGAERNKSTPAPGPFENFSEGPQYLQVWK